MTRTQKHLSWCLCCLVHEVGCCTSPGEERRAALHGRASVSGPHFTVGPLGLMADSRPVYLLGLGMDHAAAAEEPAADPASAAPIFGHCLGCALRVLHLAVTGGDDQPLFHGPSRSGQLARAARPRGGAVGCVWYNISRSNTCNATFSQFQNLNCEALPRGDVWKTQFIKPAET